MSHDSEHGHGNCREIFARLSEYLDGDLTPENRRELEEHLCGCAPCVEFVESLRRTVDLCRHYEPESQPGPMTAAAREQLLSACRKMLANKGQQQSL